MDIRTSLAENIFVSGGTTKVAGFQQRLRWELVHRLEQDRRYHRLKPLSKRIRLQTRLGQEENLPWIGASLIGAHSASKMAPVLWREYLEVEIKSSSLPLHIPDWTDFQGYHADEPEK